MRYRCSQFDTSHTLTTYIGLGYFYTTLIADHTLVTDLTILTAMALPVFAGPENTLAEKAVLFRLQRTIVDRLRLLYNTYRRIVVSGGPLTDLLRAGQTDADRVKCDRLFFHFL